MMARILLQNPHHSRTLRTLGYRDTLLCEQPCTYYNGLIVCVTGYYGVGEHQVYWRLQLILTHDRQHTTPISDGTGRSQELGMDPLSPSSSGCRAWFSSLVPLALSPHLHLLIFLSPLIPPLSSFSPVGSGAGSV